MTDDTRVGIVGLGPMGGGMRKRLDSEGWSVSGFDIDASRSEYATIEALCAVSDVVLLSLPDALAVREVALGDSGIAAVGRSGLVVADASTDDPETARALADGLHRRGIDFLDAPVSGGQKGAEEGALSMLVGGDADVLAKVRPLLAVLAKNVLHVGGVGCGQAAKLVNNLLVATELIAVAEALRLGREAGVDAETLLTAINASSGRSAVSEINFPRWILNEAFDSGFSAKLMRKDVRTALELAASRGTNLDLLERAAEIWRDSTGRLPDDHDFNRIAELDPPGNR